MFDAALILVQVTGVGTVMAVLKLPASAPFPLKVNVPPPARDEPRRKRGRVDDIHAGCVGQRRLLISGPCEREAGPAPAKFPHWPAPAD